MLPHGKLFPWAQRCSFKSVFSSVSLALSSSHISLFLFSNPTIPLHISPVELQSPFLSPFCISPHLPFCVTTPHMSLCQSCPCSCCLHLITPEHQCPILPEWLQFWGATGCMDAVGKKHKGAAALWGRAAQKRAGEPCSWVGGAECPCLYAWFTMCLINSGFAFNLSLLFLFPLIINGQQHNPAWLLDRAALRYNHGLLSRLLIKCACWVNK